MRNQIQIPGYWHESRFVFLLFVMVYRFPVQLIFQFNGVTAADIAENANEC